MDFDEKAQASGDVDRRTSIITEDGEVVNASGHKDQLSRQYGIVSICGLALTVDNAWIALGLTMTVSISNGGPAGVLYGLLIAAFYYSFIAASIAEMASAIPSAGGVYHWASILPGPSKGRVLGFFTGSLNFFGWIFDLASIAYAMAEILVQMYSLFHPDYVSEPWHVFVTLVIVCWIGIFVTIFFNSILPRLQSIGLFVLVGGGIATIVSLAALPKQHASNQDVFVWKDENNVTGWPSGLAFLLGVLNGAFTIGTPDAVTHMAEELPNPRKELPKAVAAQMTLGTVSAFLYAIALFYGVTDLGAVVDASDTLPLAQAYSQATGSVAGTFGLLFIVFLSSIPSLIGTFLTVGRTWWALARDNATPFPRFFSYVNEDLSCPVAATVLTGVLTTAFGAISLGSKTAFQDLTGSFIILSTTSYLLAILPNVLTGRKNLPNAPFRMPDSVGYAMNVLACIFIVFFNILFCFPPTYPTTVSLMSYNSVILVGTLVLTAFWWLVHGLRKYPGPKLANIHCPEGHVVSFPGK